MYKKTRWKKVKSEMLGMKCFSDELGVFTIKKIEQCNEYDRSAELPDGVYWVKKMRVFVTTNTGLKYAIPYTWIVFHSTNMDGEMLWDLLKM